MKDLEKGKWGLTQQDQWAATAADMGPNMESLPHISSHGDGLTRQVPDNLLFFRANN